MFGGVFSSLSPCSLPLAHAYAVFLSLFTFRIKGPAGYPTPLLDHLVPPSAPPRRKRSSHTKSIVRTSPHCHLTQSSHRTPHYSPITSQLDKRVEETKPSSRKGLPVPALLAIVGASRAFPSPPTLKQMILTHATPAQSRSSSSVPPYCSCTCVAPAPARSASSTACALRSSRRCTARPHARIMRVETRQLPCRCLSLKRRRWT